MNYRERMQRIATEADLDAKLLEHVLDCDEPFCQQMRKLLNYAASLRMDMRLGDVERFKKNYYAGKEQGLPDPWAD
jgi:hypothetical protein